MQKGSSGGTWTTRRLALACAAALVFLAAAATFAVRAELVVPYWVSWQTQSVAVDIDDDGTCETLETARRTCTLQHSDGSVLYESDPSWQVAQALVCDANSDGVNDLVMLIWRRGNYGTSRPFWDTAPDLRMTEHLYLMTLRKGKMMPLWMGHELGAPVERVEAGEPGVLLLTTTDGARTRWVWDDFGFTIEPA